ncbi:hypothetical protein [Bradyrhizobium sp. LTSP857]|uniref:hypothetical protein n=1 Tax=Bradyrhizobium sp. LTSP857 TaxID=1619231 RepID=UPI0005D294DA|nr:hypothetical protein [Bradyrhizobium sp. LTSP857]KJC48200.1 hypothetical protein UP06_09530 [Bradyrhizobium sp. LTSP857]
MRRCLMVGIVFAAFCGASTFAEARPPTVMNSPGYDARLQESRKALGGSTTTPVTPPTVTPKRSKKKQPN